jgi:hypothetical protein
MSIFDSKRKLQVILDYDYFQNELLWSYQTSSILPAREAEETIV